MNKVVLIQSPIKYQDVVPVFCGECLKHGIFDKIYIATNANLPPLDERCHIIRLKRDYQFATNILKALRHVDEDIVLLCCEDHVMLAPHKAEEFEETFQFIQNRENVGQLRLTCNYRVKFVSGNKSDFIRELDPKYQYLASLQPSWWRASYLRDILRAGEDAWQTELKGTKRARSHPMKKYCVTHTIFHETNFYKSGMYMRDHFADYAVENKTKLTNKLDVYVKKILGKHERDVKIVPLKNYRGNK